MPTPVSNIYPGSTTYTHEVALSVGDLKYGLRLRDGVGSIRDNAPQTTQPVDLVRQFSYHLGRGQESFLDKSRHFGYWDSKDAWLQTLGKAHPTILWNWAKGLQSQDMNWFGSVTWKKISTNSDPYLSVSWSSSGFTSTRIQFPIRRRGNPGTLTVALKNNSAGDPGATTHQSITVTTSNITDTTMVIFDGTPSSFALVAATTYHLVFSSADTDDENCWEIGCDAATAGKRSTDGSTWTATTYSPYYRLRETGTARRLYLFTYYGALYAVDSPVSGANSTLYINGGRGKATSATSTTLTDTALNMTADRYVGAWIQIIWGTGAGQARQISDNSTDTFQVAPAWDVTPDSTSGFVIYATPWWHAVGATGINGFTSAAVGSTGLGYVYSKPAASNAIVYFPQGDSVGMRRMRWNDTTKVHDFGAETATGNQGTAYFLETGFDPAEGPVIWRANNAVATGSGGTATVSRALATSWGTALAFILPNAAGTKGIFIGSANTLITGMRFHSDQILYVHKENDLFAVSNDRAVARQYPAKDMPSIYNGQAMISAESGLYIGFQTTLMQLIGGTISDTRLWLSNLPASRQGYIRGGAAPMSWVFAALDAGVSRNSSLMLWNDEAKAWHEHFRAFATGWRIRSVFWQPNDETNPYLWTEVGGELVYQVFPRTPRPLADTSVKYMPECVIETSTIDLNTNPKFFGQLKAVTKNLSESGMEIGVDYQMDNYIGSGTWFPAGKIVESPVDSLEIGVGGANKMRLRFRLSTSTMTTPPVLEQWSLEFFERTPFARYITLECEVAPSQTTAHGGGQDHKPSELFRAIQEMAKSAQVVRLESILSTLDGKTATVYAPPRAEPTSVDRNKEWSGTVSVYLYIPAKEEEVK